MTTEPTPFYIRRIERQFRMAFTEEEKRLERGADAAWLKHIAPTPRPLYDTVFCPRGHHN